MIQREKQKEKEKEKEKQTFKCRIRQEKKQITDKITIRVHDMAKKIFDYEEKEDHHTVHKFNCVVKIQTRKNMQAPDKLS